MQSLYAKVKLQVRKIARTLAPKLTKSAIGIMITLWFEASELRNGRV